ncbi:ABC transporter permease [Granulosicoccus antarcticus]|uniref:ABC transporter permease protein NatB n=1 Tax=Granulosicoccus antarcticus IMCC3135 TaxID=1192854 RepID=A0A2Z2NT58_9GAMM|nr:ABC transporter permease [Granulosicoccus antarcticus]ASJ74686.1 ABC transporter permease protein NatB [Granulosicoccus antarcticus IMCC3135]
MNLFIIMFKEILDNLRDRQTVFYALLFGPVLLPVLLGGSLVASFKQLSINFDQVTSLSVVNAEQAPQLMEFLYSNNIDITAAPENVQESVRYGDNLVVLEIPDDFGAQLRQGQPAPLTLHVNSADKESSKAERRVTAILNVYERTLNSLRLQHRGIDPSTFDSLDIIQNDVSSDGASGQLLASILPFLFIMSMVMGGFYLAIDTTAGERERHSLEPLLSLPLERSAVVFGKYGATLCFVTLSSILTALSIYTLFRLFPVELMGGQIRFDGLTVTRAFLLASPLLPFISAMLITVSAITRSTKEAQTYLGLLMLVPMAPFFLLQFLTLRSTTASMSIPMLSQYQLLESAVLGDTIPWLHIGLSAAGTLAATALLLYCAGRLYQRERLLD